MQCRVTLEIVVGVVVLADDGLVVTADSDRVTVERPNANQGAHTTPLPSTTPRPRDPANVGAAVLRDAVCGPRPKASTLRLTRRHFLFQGDDFGVGGLHAVELLARHPGQLFRNGRTAVRRRPSRLGTQCSTMLMDHGSVSGRHLWLREHVRARGKRESGRLHDTPRLSRPQRIHSP